MSALRWLLAVAALTGLLVLGRSTLDKTHIALAYLLLVLAGTAAWGRRAGIGMAIASFIGFNFFLLPPYHTLVVSDARDWLVLFAFLATSLIAAQLLHRAQTQAALAEQRGAEIGRLAALGAETLNVPRAEDAMQAIARVLQSALGIQSVEVYHTSDDHTRFRLVGHASEDQQYTVDDPTGGMFDYALDKHAVVVRRLEGGVHVLADELKPGGSWGLTQLDARVIVIPLRVRDRGVGVLRFSDAGAIRPEPAVRRFVEALAQYAALGVERVRLSVEADDAEALRAADRMKDALVAAVSHDLRTPLTAIKGLAHEIAQAGDERAIAIEQQADRLTHFVTNLLDLSALRAGGLRLQPELTAAEDLLGAALAQLAPTLPGGRAIETTLPAGAVAVGRFDFVHSLRALTNLIENALKFSPAETAVEVVVSRSTSELVFTVLDRGPGIAAADVARLFTQFMRASNGGSSAGGTGLGLAIAQGLAQAQGGRVEYAPRPGGGSSFSLFLPADTTEVFVTS